MFEEASRVIRNSYILLLFRADSLLRSSFTAATLSPWPNYSEDQLIRHPRAGGCRRKYRVGVPAPREPAPGGRLLRIQPAVDRQSSTGHRRDQLSLSLFTPTFAISEHRRILVHSHAFDRVEGDLEGCNDERTRAPYVYTHWFRQAS